MSAARRAEAAVEQPLARQVTSQAGAGPVAAAEPATGVCGAAPGDASGVDSSAAEAAESTGIEQAGIVAAGPVRPAGEVETGQAGQADATEPAWEADPGRVPAEPQSVDDWLDDAVELLPMFIVGAVETIAKHGSEEQKQTFLPKMSQGLWSGTMNLSEPQAGTDLFQVATKTVP